MMLMIYLKNGNSWGRYYNYNVYHCFNFFIVIVMILIIIIIIVIFLLIFSHAHII